MNCGSPVHTVAPALVLVTKELDVGGSDYESETE
jgi:hypothetical protein